MTVWEDQNKKKDQNRTAENGWNEMMRQLEHFTVLVIITFLGWLIKRLSDQFFAERKIQKKIDGLTEFGKVVKSLATVVTNLTTAVTNFNSTVNGEVKNEVKSKKRTG